MPTCYLLTVSRLSAAEKPMCFVSVAETEADAVANVVEGYRDFLGREQRPFVSGSLLPDAARRLAIPIDRSGHVSCASAYIG
ncbi:hypothetical protein [Salinarimonas sp.]|uniref:hypothetical protein n=1 Tax=Salinarimonas sp. TaxID=2766526 RepID=UPI0032D970D2